MMPRGSKRCRIRPPPTYRRHLKKKQPDSAPTEHLAVVQTIVVKKDQGNAAVETDSATATRKKAAAEVATEPPSLNVAGNNQ
jgi:hypothetical protein